MSDTSLEDVLVRLGFVTRQRLAEVRDQLSMTTEEEKFGKLLIAHGVVSEEQLKEAWGLISDLRDSDKTVRAMAASDLAERHTAAVVTLASHIKRRAGSIAQNARAETRRQTGEAHPIVTAEMLGEPSPSK